MSDYTDVYGPRDIVGYGPDPPNAQWPNRAKIAISIVLNYEEGSEATPVNGDPVAEHTGTENGAGKTPMKGRDVTTESFYEYGSRAGVWRLLRLFREQGIKITCYAIGMALLLNPQVSKVLEQDGHEIASHGWRWVNRDSWTVEQEAKYVEQTIDAIEKTAPSGKAPRGWYWGKAATAAGLHSRGLVAKIFKEKKLPLKYWSDDYSDDLPFWIPYPDEPKEGLLVIPYALDTNDFRDSQYSSWITPDNFFAYLKATFDELYREGQSGTPKMFSIGLHCRLVGRPGRIAGLRKFIEYAKGFEGVWFATREEIADHWAQTHPYQPQA